MQAYLNTHDSLNRIWPWIDAASVFDPKTNTPDCNFYYEADAAHNPTRAVVWTDAYVDPAGQGWLVSAVSPVYRGDFLEAVVGVRVQDRGEGMDEETQRRIFERFYRAESASATAGTGLGMSIVKEIMDIHGGRVEVESTPGAGTAVTLWLRRTTPCG